jgi:hypothetical protein
MTDPALFIPIVNHLPAPAHALCRLLASGLPVELGVEFPPPVPPPRAAMNSHLA